MSGNAEIILVTDDGSLVLQHRDDKPGITNPGFVSSFGGHIEAGETSLEAAHRELHEETNLKVDIGRFEYFGHYRKTKQVHGEDWDVHYFVVRGIGTNGLEVYEGQGYLLLKDEDGLKTVKATTLLQEVLHDFYAKNKLQK